MTRRSSGRSRSSTSRQPPHPSWEAVRGAEGELLYLHRLLEDGSWLMAGKGPDGDWHWQRHRAGAIVTQGRRGSPTGSMRAADRSLAHRPPEERARELQNRADSGPRPRRTTT